MPLAHLSHDRRVGHVYPVFLAHAIETYATLIGLAVPMPMEPDLDATIEKDIDCVRLTATERNLAPYEYVQNVFREQVAVNAVDERIT